jgi:hypothetical protein
MKLSSSVCWCMKTRVIARDYVEPTMSRSVPEWKRSGNYPQAKLEISRQA